MSLALKKIDPVSFVFVLFFTCFRIQSSLSKFWRFSSFLGIFRNSRDLFTQKKIWRFDHFGTWTVKGPRNKPFHELSCVYLLKIITRSVANFCLFLLKYTSKSEVKKILFLKIFSQFGRGYCPSPPKSPIAYSLQDPRCNEEKWLSFNLGDKGSILVTPFCPAWPSAWCVWKISFLLVPR